MPLPLPSDPPIALAPPAGIPRADDPLRGILLVVAATVFFSLSDAVAKHVSVTLPVLEVAWMRYLVFVALTLAPAARHGCATLRTRRPALQTLRGVSIVVSAILFLYGLRLG